MTAHVLRARTAVQTLITQAQLLAIDTGVADGGRDYRPFVILGQARSGANLLRGMLNAHGGILAFGEIFRVRDTIDWGIPHWRTPRQALELARHEPIRFLDTHVFRSYPPSVRGVGFKLFSDHARESHRRAVWDYVFGRRDLAVLHLRRRNLLKALVSLRRAEWDGHGVAASNYVRPTDPVRLTYEESRRYFEQSIRRDAEFGSRCAGKPTLELYYEDLLSDGSGEQARIQAFLGVEPRVLPARVTPSAGTLHESILGFSELKRQFSSTPWREFFEE